MPVPYADLDTHAACAYIVRMRPTYDHKAPKRATNLSINSDLLTMARKLDINLSATMEMALEDAVTRGQRERWLAENRNAMAAYNDYVETNGVFSDGLRGF